MSEPGIFVQQAFPFAAYGPRQWSVDEMRCLFRWLKQMGYGRVYLKTLPIWLHEDDEHTILEMGGLFHSGTGLPPSFAPSMIYCPDDNFLGTPEGLANAERFRGQMQAAREEGLQVWTGLSATLGAPQFAREHPELACVKGTDNFVEGISLCPSKPEALEHVLGFWRRHIEHCGPVEGVLLWMRDAGGCMCRMCQPQDETMARLANQYYDMLQELQPGVTVVFMSWHVAVHEVEKLAARLHPAMHIFEAPRIHAMDVPIEQFVGRIERWKQQGRHVEGWVEIQENPTALLPSVYPKRLERTIARMRQMDLKGLWGTAAMTPYVFPLHHWLMPRLWEGDRPLDELLREWLTESFSADSVDAGMEYLQTTEAAWESTHGVPFWEAGFLGLFVVSFPDRMLPERCMQEGVSDELRDRIESASQKAQAALAAANKFADCVRLYHTQEANTIGASARVLAHRIEMRRAKLPVLDAIHAGDINAAVSAWSGVEEACRKMVAAAHDAPNTDALAKHWRRLDLLPDRLTTLALHLAELCETKAFRPIRQKLYWGEVYKKPSDKSAKAAD